jgi:hypothetical protein
VDLVANLAEAKPESSDRSNLQEVWAGDDQQSCMATCLRLKDEGMPYQVPQRRKQFLKGNERHFNIAVPSSFCRQAKLAGRDTLDFSDDREDQAIMELPDNGVVASVSSSSAAGRSLMIISSLRENFI